MIGIYKITNVQTNMCYIGKSIDISRRFRKHKNYLNNDMHHNIYLQRAWHKYGAESFVFEVIEECDESSIDYLETLYIQKYDAYGANGYNMNLGGEKGRGYKHEDEFKEKQRVRNSGGKKPKARKVICDGIIYNTVRECADHYNINEKTMNKWLTGYRKTRRDFVQLGLKYIDNQ